MNVLIKKIVDIGVYEKERIILNALTDGDIGRHAIFLAKKNQTGITNAIENVYWFPDKKIQAGDLVVLYTNEGFQSETHNNNGTTTHFFHWGLSTTLPLSTYAVTLVDIPEWKVFNPED